MSALCMLFLILFSFLKMQKPILNTSGLKWTYINKYQCCTCPLNFGFFKGLPHSSDVYVHVYKLTDPWNMVSITSCPLSVFRLGIFQTAMLFSKLSNAHPMERVQISWRPYMYMYFMWHWETFNAWLSIFFSANAHEYVSYYAYKITCFYCE